MTKYAYFVLLAGLGYALAACSDDDKTSQGTPEPSVPDKPEWYYTGRPPRYCLCHHLGRFRAADTGC